MNKIKCAIKWFLDGLTFRFGYDLDWDFISVGVSYNRGYWVLDPDMGAMVERLEYYEPAALTVYLGPLSLFLEGKEPS